MVSFRGFKKWLRLREIEVNLQELAIGMNSTVDLENDMHVLMLDFDIADEEMVIEAVEETQAFWNLADAHMYETRNGFHVIFFTDIMPYERCKMIINYTKYVDPLYKYVSRYHDHKTLRTAGKHKEKDIVFKRILLGRRKPTIRERETGKLKEQEHNQLRGLEMREAKAGKSKGSE